MAIQEITPGKGAGGVERIEAIPVGSVEEAAFAEACEGGLGVTFDPETNTMVSETDALRRYAVVGPQASENL